MDEAQIQEMTPEGVGAAMRARFGSASYEFRPCAFFDEQLDCIRVVARDCSVSEWRVSPLLTVLEDNYADPEAGRELYVGFVVKGARHFCREQGMDLTVPIQMSELLDKILNESPEDVVRLAINAIARPLVRKGHIKEVTLLAA